MQRPAYGSGRDRRRLEKTTTPGIYKRVPAGSYCVIVRVDGKQVRRYAKTLAQARALKAELTTDRDRGEYRPETRVAFEDYARSWIETYAGRTSRGFREKTREQYRDALERHAIPFFKGRRLSSLTPLDIKNLIKHIASSGVSYNTVRIYLAPVKAMLADAYEDGLIRANPAAGVRIARQVSRDAEEDQAKALTPDELRALLNELEGDHRLLVEFLVSTGLRIGEAVALTWRDIDLGRRRVKVRRTFYRGQTAPPKSSYGVRDVPLSPGLSQRLWQLRKDAGNAPEIAHVFTGSRGAPFDATNGFNRVLKPAARRAGVPWAGWHALRHTCATMLFRSGWNAKQVQRFLGHHAASFTLDTYVHLLPEDMPQPTFMDNLAETGQAATSSPELLEAHSKDSAENEPAVPAKVEAR